MKRKSVRINIYTYTVKSTICPLCRGSATEYAVLYGHLPVRPGSPMWKAANYHCSDCGMSAQAGRKPEHTLHGNGQHWPMKVPRQVRRFVQHGKISDRDVVAAGEPLDWFPYGGTALAGEELVLATIQPIVIQRKLYWRRRDYIPTNQRRRSPLLEYVDYPTFPEAVRTGACANLARCITSHYAPQIQLLSQP